MVVSRQRSPDSQSFHHYETGAIGDAPFLIKPLAQIVERRLEQFRGLRLNGDVGIPSYSLYKVNRGLALLPGGSASGV